MNSKIAIFGGTFNPVHLGHINLCCSCAKIWDFDKVLLIPSNLPPHKKTSDLASNSDRMNMLKLAIENNSRLEVSDIEFKLEGKSYSINTIERLKQIYPNDELYMIIGSDMLYMFDEWYRYEDILKNVYLVVGAREQSELEKLEQYVKKLKGFENKVLIAQIDVKPMSSTDIREMIKKGDDGVKAYLNQDVLSYINQNHLYSGDLSE